MFLSLFASVQVIVREHDVYTHERCGGVGIGPYLASKLLPLLLIGAAIVGVINIIGGMQGVALLPQFIVLLGTSAASMVFGLAISALVLIDSRQIDIDGATMAVMLMNVVVIPQMLFTDALVPLEGAAKWVADSMVTANWAFDAFDHLIRSSIAADHPEVLEDMMRRLGQERGLKRHWTTSLDVVGIHTAMGWPCSSLRCGPRSRLACSRGSPVHQPPRALAHWRLRPRRPGCSCS